MTGDQVWSEELYDHRGDVGDDFDSAAEMANLASHPSFTATLNAMRVLLAAHFQPASAPHGAVAGTR